ncbi:hypothetical protein Q5H92_26355 [Hymenobacter sp. M29]|uniref:Uncharacterized protein n=1 Tax=Hymenobacter mellowenesis TaxID=3063995 RepID=A0ABT9AJ89_9BACT|nr:hypothetical protein [Hymenobacter sp. M29]MDO7849909.1 hypothetical protein [Hymenobacter sp. M29]
MSKITITDESGAKCTGRLPSSWADVSLAQYAALAAAANWPDRCRALAALCDLPAQPFLDDVSLCLPILRGAPFLLDGPLPMPGTDGDTSFRHAGTTYVPAPADLDKIAGAQLEALLNFLLEHDGNALACAPALLAVLYKPAGKKPLFGPAPDVPLTADVVEASARAFESLPMSVAWPLIGNFLSRSAATATSIAKFLAVQPAAEQLLSAMETHLTTSGRSGFCWNFAAWALVRWTKRVRNRLTISSLPFAFTGPLTSSSSAPTAPARDE